MNKPFAGSRMHSYLDRFASDGMTNTANHSATKMTDYTKVMDGNSQSFKDIGGSLDNVGNNNSGYIDINNGIENAHFTDNRRYYGGDSRSFTYKGGSGESSLYDSPMSMATMAGYYDTNDSPGETSKFLDKYMNENRIYQTNNDAEYKKTGTFDYDSDKSRAIDYGAYHDRVFNTHGPDMNYKNSDYEMGRLFGDMQSWVNNPPTWVNPKPPAKPKDEEDLQELMEGD